MKKIAKTILIMALVVLMVFVLINAKDAGAKKPKPKKLPTFTEITDLKGWTSYTGDAEPTSAGFSKGKEEDAAKVTIVKDKEIPGNNLLKFEGPGDSAIFTSGISDSEAVTLVLRVKATETAKRSWEVEVRSKGVREKVRQELGKTNLERSKNSIDFKEDNKWHIWRIVMVFTGSSVKTTVYMDESDIPAIENSESTDSGTPSRISFGDGSTSEMYGCYYDWIVWRTDGAFKPSEKPLPVELTGLPSTEATVTTPPPAK